MFTRQMMSLFAIVICDFNYLANQDRSKEYFGALWLTPGTTINYRFKYRYNYSYTLDVSR